MPARPRFTVAELDLIQTMAAIASAQSWGEGDYQDWDETTAGVYDSLCEKVAALKELASHRKGGSGAR